jgi:hypothetical protein
MDQLIKIFRKYAADHPEYLHESAIFHGQVAFGKFLCP